MESGRYETVPGSGPDEKKRRRAPLTGNLLRFIRYILVRLLVLAVTAVIGVWVTIVAVNLGGYVDEIIKTQIRTAISLSMRPDPDATPEERTAALEEAIAAAQDAAGVNEPFLLRTVRWTAYGVSLQLGESRSLRSLHPRGMERRNVRVLILERVPATLLLLGVTNLFIFFSSIILALRLSRQYGKWLDRLIISLSPTSAAPSWFYGLFLIAIFAGGLSLFPYGGMTPSPPPDTRWEYALGVGRHLFLPFLAIFISTFFQSVYVWRTFFLIYSSEDYVEMARAKGLTAAAIERRYILRPSLPPIITSFAFVIIGIWSGSVILETVFNWPGLGQLFFMAIGRQETNVLIGLAVVYAFFLALTIFVLDLSYGLVDPRVRSGEAGHGGSGGKLVSRAGRAGWRGWLSRALLGWAWQRWRPAWQSPPPTLATSAPALPPPLASSEMRRTRFSLRRSARSFWDSLKDLARMGVYLKQVAGEVIRYPSAILGLLIISFLLGMTVYAVAAMPYEQAVREWSLTSDRRDYPRNARPIWFNFFTTNKRVETMIIDSRDEGEERVAKEVEQFAGRDEINLTFTFDYVYDRFPNELMLHLYAPAVTRSPHVDLFWITPDGREIRMAQLAPRGGGDSYRPDQDERLRRRLGGVEPIKGLFADPDQETLTPLKGRYQLKVEGLVYDGADLEARFVIHGDLYGWAGTDHRRRDLLIPLLWGTPTAMAFGLLAAIFTSMGTMLIAGFGVWFGGSTDELIQRLTDINLVIPTFPILAMITLFYTLSIWYILALAVLLSILSSNIKTYRAIFLQIKEAPFIEAALAYGAGNNRIIFFYLIPRIIPVLIPQMVILVPSYVFLEASIAFLGLSDPLLPTWGKVINDAHLNSALLNGHYYWIMQPAVLLLITGFAFALLGFALDRIFNPRLREV